MAGRSNTRRSNRTPKTPTTRVRDSYDHESSVGLSARKTIDKTVDEVIQVTPEESLNLIKIISLATISEIALTRKLVPEDSYKQRVLHLDKAPSTYSDFTKSELPKDHLQYGDPNHAVFNILERQKYPHVDKLLDWIEYGAHDALQKGYLASMRLTLFDTIVKADKVVESFELHFSDTDENTERSSSSNYTVVELNSAKKDARTLLESVRRNFRAYFHQPEARPEKLIVSMQLTYTPKTLEKDPLYQPPGFTDLIDHRILHAGKKRRNIGEMSSGIQSTSIYWFNNNVDDKTSMESSPGFLSLGTPRVESRKTQSMLVGELSTASTPLQEREERRAVREMAMPRDVLDDQADTQALTNNSQMFQQSQNISQETRLQVPEEKYVFSQKTIAMVTKNNSLMDRTIVEGAKNIKITCDCNVKTHTADMLQCHSCFDQQHLECYGYSDDKRPLVHFCYNCLLEDHDLATLSKLRSLAFRRRAVQYMAKRGFPLNKRDLQKHLSCSFTAINKLNEELKVEGYLQPNPDFNPRAKDAKTREYIFNDSTEQLQRLRREYQDPTIHIAHLMELPAQDKATFQEDDDGTTKNNIVIDDSSTASFPSPSPDSLSKSIGPYMLSMFSSPMATTQSQETSIQNSMPPPITPTAAGRKRKVSPIIHGSFKRFRGSSAHSPFPVTPLGNRSL